MLQDSYILCITYNSWMCNPGYVTLDITCDFLYFLVCYVLSVFNHVTIDCKKSCLDFWINKLETWNYVKISPIDKFDIESNNHAEAISHQCFSSKIIMMGLAKFGHFQIKIGTKWQVDKFWHFLFWTLE